MGTPSRSTLCITNDLGSGRPTDASRLRNMLVFHNVHPGLVHRFLYRWKLLAVTAGHFDHQRLRLLADKLLENRRTSNFT